MFSGCGTSRRHVYIHLFYESYVQGISESFGLCLDIGIGWEMVLCQVLRAQERKYASVERQRVITLRLPRLQTRDRSGACRAAHLGAA